MADWSLNGDWAANGDWAGVGAVAPTVTHTSDVVLAGISTATHATDVTIQASGSIVHTTDAVAAEVAEGTLTHTTDLVVESPPTMWVSDGSTDRIYQEELDGTPIRNFAYPNVAFASVTFDGGIHLYIVESLNDEIWKVDTLDGSVVGTISAPTTTPHGLEWDSATETLWYVDGSSDDSNVYRIDPADGSILQTIPVALDWIDAVTFDGDNLWLAEPGEGLIYEVGVDGTPIRSIPRPGTRVTGMGWLAGHLWVADFITDRVYELDPVDGSVLHFHTSPGSTPMGVTFSELSPGPPRLIHTIDVLTLASAQTAHTTDAKTGSHAALVHTTDVTVQASFSGAVQFTFTLAYEVVEIENPGIINVGTPASGARSAGQTESALGRNQYALRNYRKPIHIVQQRRR